MKYYGATIYYTDPSCGGGFVQYYCTTIAAALLIYCS